MKNVFTVIAALTLLGLSMATAAAITIDTVTVGNPGNSADTTGYGAVDNNYNIGRYEVTVGQYVDFLNWKEVDKSTPLLMTPGNLAANHIELVTGVNPFLFRTTDSQYDNNSVTGVSYWNACRFVNWLGNGQGNGDTETGAYTLNNYDGSAGGNITRNPGATWVLPTIDEWYKAAYYAGGTDGVYYGDPTASTYGTVNQYGDGWEWTESVMQVDAIAGRILGGGNGPIDASVPVDFKGTSLGDPSRSGGPSLPWTPGVPLDNSFSFTFRVASVPEPSSIIALLGGLGSLLAFRRRRA